MKKLYYKNILIFFIFAIILLFGVISINYYGDAGCLFSRSHSFENKLVDALLEKNKVLVCVNYNERNVKRLLLSKISTPPEILILGSSRTMPISQNLFNNPRFFNASVSTANLEDDIALYYLFYQRGWKPKTILIGLDPWIVTNNIDEPLWKITFSSEYSKALQGFFGEEEGSLKYYQKMSGLSEKYAQLLSLNYLKDSLKKVALLQKFSFSKSDEKNLIINPSLAQINNFPDCPFQLPDGTRLPSVTEESSSSFKADYEGGVEVHRYSSALMRFDYKKVQTFERFIRFLQQQNIQIIFYLPPLEPAGYAEIERNPDYKIVNRIENYFYSVASKYHLRIIGSYNPSNLNLTSNDFIDDVHLKKHGIDKILGKI